MGLVALVSAVLVCVGKDDFVFAEVFKISPEKLPHYMRAAFFTGIIFPLVIAPIDLIITRRKNEKLEEMVPKMLTILKKQFNAELKSILAPASGTDFNIRVFLPVKGKEKLFRRFFRREEYFKIKNVPGLADDELTNDLCFKVHPVPVQGLVGRTYQDKTIYFDYSPRNTEKVKYYNLDSYQICHTSRAEFVATGHIETADGRIIAVLAIDCSSKIVENKANEENVTEIVREYCKIVDKVLPLIK